MIEHYLLTVDEENSFSLQSLSRQWVQPPYLSVYMFRTLALEKKHLLYVLGLTHLMNGIT